MILPTGQALTNVEIETIGGETFSLCLSGEGKGFPICFLAVKYELGHDREGEGEALMIATRGDV